MASDSQTATATMYEKPLENKEANMMEKEIVLSETADVVKDKPVSDSNLTVTEEEKVVQTHAEEPEKEPPAHVDEVVAVVKEDESTDKEKGENGEKKVAEQVKLKEQNLVKECVTVEEVVDEERAEEKRAVESVAEENKKDTKEKMVDVSESIDEAGGKQVEPLDVQLVGQVSVEDNLKDVEALEAKDAVTKLATEDENITEDTAADIKSGGETLKETDTDQSTQGNKQEESITEKVETETVVKESDEQKQEREVTAKEEDVVKTKHSNSIMSKVKQSLVKAKKAIIGKSPSSKTITTEEKK